MRTRWWLLSILLAWQTRARYAEFHALIVKHETWLAVCLSYTDSILQLEVTYLVHSLHSCVPLRLVREKEQWDGWPGRAPVACCTQRGSRGHIKESARSTWMVGARRAVAWDLPQGTCTGCTYRTLQERHVPDKDTMATVRYQAGDFSIQ